MPTVPSVAFLHPQDYKGMTQQASLLPDGRISSSIGGQQQVFESPSAFRCVLPIAAGCTAAQIGRGRVAWRFFLNAIACLNSSHSLNVPALRSIYLKRLLNPTRKADDGWKTGQPAVAVGWVGSLLSKLAVC